MPANDVQQLLQDLDDTRELVLRYEDRVEDALLGAWRAAHREAGVALAHWLTRGGGVAWTVYLAAEDRADAALEALAASR